MTADINPDMVSALLVGRFELDRALITDVFGKCGWHFFEATERSQVLQLLGSLPFHVVIAETDGPMGDWKELLRDLRDLPNPPQLIVASRHADDYLWSEVLNVGAFDVLSQPLARDETQRVVAAARRHFDLPNRLGVAAPLRHSSAA